MPADRKIYLIRHCQAAGQEPDAALTEEGEWQAGQLLHFFAKQELDLLVSSPYERALATIRPLAQSRGLPVQTDERLRERILSSENMPDWMDKLRQTYADPELKFQGGESSAEATERGLIVLRELLTRPECRIALVTHGNLMSLLLRYFDSRFGFEAWRGLTNPDIYELQFHFDESDETTVRRIWQPPSGCERG